MTQLYTQDELVSIGTAAMELMSCTHPDRYQEMMLHEDAWFGLCVGAVPYKEDELIEEIQKNKLPLDQIGTTINSAELVVYGFGLSEFKAYNSKELSYSGFICIRAAQSRAESTLSKLKINGYQD